MSDFFSAVSGRHGAGGGNVPAAVWAWRCGNAHATGVLPVGGGVVAGGFSSDMRFRAASVLKPVVAWAVAGAAEYRGSPLLWAQDAAGAVLVSDNLSTEILWTRVGGTETVLGRVEELTGVRVQTDGSEHTDPYAFAFGRVVVTAEEVAHMYMRLVAAAGSGDETARAVVGWMTQTLPSQRFRAAPYGNRDPVKCGWSASSDETLLRTHAVRVVHHLSGNPKVGVVLTALPFPEGVTKDEYERLSRSGCEVTHVNDKAAGRLISMGMVQAFNR